MMISSGSLELLTGRDSNVHDCLTVTRRHRGIKIILHKSFYHNQIKINFNNDKNVENLFFVKF